MAVNDRTKYTIVILLDDQEHVYQATASHLQPWEALRIAWERVARQMGIPYKPNGNGQAQAPTTPPPPSPVPSASSGQALGEADEPRCPVHHDAQPSRYGGLFCPTYDEAAEVFCNWTYGRPKAKKGGK